MHSGDIVCICSKCPIGCFEKKLMVVSVVVGFRNLSI